jgi:hypothetical protein
VLLSILANFSPDDNNKDLEMGNDYMVYSYLPLANNLFSFKSFPE